jgi:hypothetical protein
MGPLISLRKNRCALALLCSLPLYGCAGEAPGDVPEDVDTLQSPIFNGDDVAAPGINVLVKNSPSFPAVVCSGTLLTDRWVVVAKSCEAGAAAMIYRGAETRAASQVVNHPDLDITLVQAASAFPNVFVTSMFPWEPARLLNRQLTCYGYGFSAAGNVGAGTLRKGNVLVNAGTSTRLTVGPADAKNQLPWVGDTGGGCFIENTSRALAGVVIGFTATPDGSAPSKSYLIPTSAFSQWAIPIIAGSTPPLACLGRECVSNPRPLPNNVSSETAWQPCPGQLTGPGGYRFDYDIQYNFERGYDRFTVNGQSLTGAGSLSGTGAPASHLGHRLSTYTDRSVQSPGVSWLRAKCPNDP